MSLNLNNVFGIYEKALNVHEKRTSLLANNIANQNTPGYKAKDIDFRATLASEATKLNSGLQMQTSNANHMSLDTAGVSYQEKFRQPLSTSLDGNTVDAQQEVSQFSENALRYQANLNFIDGRISSILMAFRGE